MEALHQPGDIIAQRYRITDTLGQGGVGITYAAEDLKSGETVALKALSLRQMGDWKVLELFEREAKILAHLNHPAIPRYLDYFQIDTSEDRAFYIVQQLAEGKSLADLAKIGWRTNEDGVRKIASQILEILLYLHELKPPVVHRDIKPQNLIWGKDGKIFLVDFGAVQHTYRSTLAKGSTIVGTYGYMAPEQFRGQAVPATDLYGLGATVLFLMTHRSPSDLPQERLKISFRSRIQVSSGFADWLEKMLEPDVEDRFSSAKDALAALQGRMVVAKPRRSVSWKVLAGVGIAGVAAFFVLKSYKWAVLGVIGVQPSGICVAASSGNFDVVRDYLKHGGDPDAKDEGEVPIMPCLLKMEHATKDIAELLIAKVSDVNAKDNEGKTPLHLARSKEMVELLIAKVSDVNAKDNEGKTPLHLARSKEIAELLIAKGADVNAKDNQGNTPLDKAFQVMVGWFPVESQRQNQIDLAKLLIGKGAYAAKVNAKDNTGETLLHHAATKNGKKELAKLLIAKGAQVNAKSQSGYTPLHWAAGHDKDLAELLIAKGADVNAKDNQGVTPLHRVHLKAVAELLITKGADVKAKSNQGVTPLHGASSKGVAELLIAKGVDVNAKDNQGQTPLHMPWDKDLVALLIAKGADVNARDNQGQTPLHMAVDDVVLDRDKDLAGLLIAKGADVNARDNRGKAPLHMARDKDLAGLLIAKGANVNAKDNQGKTSLHEGRDKDWVALLIAKGADVNARDNQGKTLLNIVLGWDLYWYKEVVPLLIAKGADVNAKDNQGTTPLNVAFQNLSGIPDIESRRIDFQDAYAEIALTILDTVVLLMAKGAQFSNNEVNPKDNQGYTLLHYAARDGSKKAVEVLIAKGSQVNANDNQCGCTPLHWAAKNGSKDTAELLIAKGAAVNAKAKSGLTPLDYATIMRQENMVKLLKSHGAVGHSCRKIDGSGIVCQVNP